jgi:MFS family permease
MLSWMRPADRIGEREVQDGLRALLYDGAFSQIMATLTGGAILVAFALLLGASNTVIGLLAAIGPLTQLLQIPAIYLVDRTALRKALTVVSSLVSRVFWLVVAFIPWLVSRYQSVPVLLVCLFLYFGLGTIAGCAFNSWMRDFVPEKILGRFFGRRMAVATAVGAVLTLLAGVGIEIGKRYVPNDYLPFSALFVLGGLAGLVGVYFLAQVPEPRMAVHEPRGMFAALGQPFRDFNFRRLLIFLGTWNFAINLAAPFFAVYMIKRLQLSMALVLGLSVVSQMMNVMFFRVWGRAADRFSNKSVLSVSGSMFIVSILLWPFLTMPERYLLTIPLLVVIHVLAGISIAGVNLCAGNIALKSAPQGQATAFLAANAVVNGLAATVAPILAGVAADGFTGQELSLTLRWSSGRTGSFFSLPAFDLRGLDFVFILAVIVGLYAMHRLLAVREEGEVEEGVVVAHLVAEARRTMRHISNIDGLRQLYAFPFARLEEADAEPGHEPGEDSSGEVSDGHAISG